MLPVKAPPLSQSRAACSGWAGRTAQLLCVFLSRVIHHPHWGREDDGGEAFGSLGCGEETTLDCPGPVGRGVACGARGSSRMARTSSLRPSRAGEPEMSCGPPASRPTRAENGGRRLALESRSGWSEPPEVWAGTPEAWQGAALISTLLD